MIIGGPESAGQKKWEGLNCTTVNSLAPPGKQAALRE